MIYLGQDPVGITTEPDVSGKADKVANATNGNFAALDSNGNITDSGHAHADYAQKTDYATADTAGVVKVSTSGLQMFNDGSIGTLPATNDMVKAGSASYRPIVPDRQHRAVFYGLAKAAGDTTQSQSSNEIGTYTDAAKSAISTMLNSAVSVSGTTPTITGLPGLRYMCGTVDSISITPPQTGIIDVVFTSGTTPTVLTVPNTVRFPAWFDPNSLNASTVYDITIKDGYGVVNTWT